MSYLDTGKSVIISSPAGSGKTEKLARRYIALLQSGVKVDRILAVTFTDKAAAEMKQRILRILKNESPKLFMLLLEKMSLMRVTTIHSFCGTLLRRFSFEAGIDPNYRVENAIDSRIGWEEIIYSLLMEAGSGDSGHELFMQTIGEKGFRGLKSLNDTINNLYEKRPFSLEAYIAYEEPVSLSSLISELSSWEGVREAVEGYDDILKHPASMTSSFEGFFLTQKKEPRKRPPKGIKGIADYPDWVGKMYILWKEQKLVEYKERAERIRDIFSRCLERHTNIKKTRSLLDFSDLEHIAFRMLTEEPEWANILYAFDEKTDHILVDEFQDTNSFQWAIIDSLTEEWRSGIGAKREDGIKPTIFLVGDKKQSIYFFRGANVEIFQKAKDKLGRWLGDAFHYEEVKENYRSAPAIISFTNSLFSKIMSAGDGSPAWMTEYGTFNAQRKEPAGMVEIIMLDGDEDGVAAEREKEAELIARKIKGLINEYRVTERDTGEQRSSRYMDIAILLKKRTHLKRYEEALRRNGIPFIALKGIGFYQEPEVAMLRALVYFLSNPKDDYSLYVLLKSPLFMHDEGVILKAVNTEGDSLFIKLRNSSNGENRSYDLLDKWLSLLPDTPIAELIERVLVETGAWGRFHDSQKHANIKKFIRLMEDLEADGRPLLKIRGFLEKTIDEGKEPKANVNTESMDAVRIMTIHASKGLEFPLVFLPGIEESFSLKSDESLIFEKESSFFMKSITEPSIRRDDGDFRLHLMKQEEEQKRLFYVAVTRAEEALFLTARWKERGKSFLSYLKDGIGLHKTDGGYSIAEEVKGLSLLSEDDIPAHDEQTLPDTKKRPPLSMKFIHITARTRKEWHPVTSGLDISSRHEEDWKVPGEVLHTIFEKISKDTINEKDIPQIAEKLLRAKGVRSGGLEEGLDDIEKTTAVLKERGVWQEIIMPVKDSYTELPFVLEHGDKIYKGRIDRVIKEEGAYNIYDYKTFPVEQDEIDNELEKYRFQLNIYKQAVKKIFNTEDVRSFIVFTYNGETREA